MNTRRTNRQTERQRTASFPGNPGQLDRILATLTRHYRALGLSEARARASALADFARESLLLR